MRKNVFGKQLSRDKNERAGLFKGLISSLVLNESIKTTEAKAKAIKGEVDKLVTKAKNENTATRGLLGKRLNPQAIEKMVTSIAPRFANRNGGYTRIVRLGKRFGDDAPVVLLEWVEKPIQALESKIKNKELKADKKNKDVKVAEVKSTKKVARTTAKKPAKRSNKK